MERSQRFLHSLRSVEKKGIFYFLKFLKLSTKIKLLLKLIPLSRLRASTSPPEYRFCEALRATALSFGLSMPNQGMFTWLMEGPCGAPRSEAREMSAWRDLNRFLHSLRSVEKRGLSLRSVDSNFGLRQAFVSKSLD